MKLLEIYIRDGERFAQIKMYEADEAIYLVPWNKVSQFARQVEWQEAKFMKADAEKLFGISLDD